MNKKRVIACLLICCLILSVSACRDTGKGKDQEQQVQGEDTIISYYDNLRNFEYTDKIVNKFNRQSKGTKVSVKYIIDGIYDETIAMNFSAGDTEMDCLTLSQASKSNGYATAGLLAPVGEYVQNARLNLASYGSAIEVVKLEGELYSLPIRKNSWMLFYNKDYFQRMGVAYPQQMTWDEYIELAKQLTYKENGKTYWGGFISPQFMNLGAAAAEEYLTDDELPLTKRYVGLLNQVYNIDKSHPDVLTMMLDYGEPYSLVKSQRVAMMIEADWAISRLQSDDKQKPLGFEWDIAPLPIFESMDQGTTVGNCSYLGISSFSENSSGAFAFAAFLCGEEGAMIMAENAACPAYLVDGTIDAYLENADVAGAKYFFDSTTYNMESAHPQYESISTAFEKEMNYYLMGGKTIDQAFTDFYQSRSALLTREDS